MNDRINPVGSEHAASREASQSSDWTKEIELLQARLKEIRRAAASAPSKRAGDHPDAGHHRAAETGAGKSLLESLAYAQAVTIRQERPKKTTRKPWRTESVYEPTLGSDIFPDGGWKNREDRGDR